MWSDSVMTFGERVRELRKEKGLTLRQLAAKVGVGFTYLSRVETGRMTYGEYPSDALIHKLADALDADEEALLLLAERIPDRIRRRVLQRPDVFGALASCDDRTLDKLMCEIGQTPSPRKAARKK
jgi:transcriptional regulator with XRE-family HTH domain